MSPEHLDVVVGEDGEVKLSRDQLEQMGVHPGDHVRLVKEETTVPRKRKSVRGLGVGKIAPEDVLTWGDFEAAHQDNVKIANEKYGELSE